MSDRYYTTDALSYLKDNEYSFANGPDVDQIIELLEFLKERGVEKCFIGIDENDIWDSDDVEIFPSAELFIYFPKNVPTQSMIEILVEIAHLRPNEISQENDDSVRLWWD